MNRNWPDHVAVAVGVADIDLDLPRRTGWHRHVASVQQPIIEHDDEGDALTCVYHAWNRLVKVIKATDSTTVAEQDSGLEALGNWGTYTQKASGSATLNQTRTHNKSNEINTIGIASGGMLSPLT